RRSDDGSSGGHGYGNLHIDWIHQFHVQAGLGGEHHVPAAFWGWQKLGQCWWWEKKKKKVALAVDPAPGFSALPDLTPLTFGSCDIGDFRRQSVIHLARRSDDFLNPDVDIGTSDEMAGTFRPDNPSNDAGPSRNQNGASMTSGAHVIGE